MAELDLESDPNFQRLPESDQQLLREYVEFRKKRALKKKGRKQ